MIRYVFFNTTTGLVTQVAYPNTEDDYVNKTIYNGSIAVFLDETDATSDTIINTTWHWDGERIDEHNPQVNSYYLWNSVTFDYESIVPAPAITGITSKLGIRYIEFGWTLSEPNYLDTIFSVTVFSRNINTFAGATNLGSTTLSTFRAENVSTTPMYYWLQASWDSNNATGTEVSLGLFTPSTVVGGDLAPSTILATNLAAGAVKSQLSGTGVNVMNPRYCTFEETSLPPMRQNNADALVAVATQETTVGVALIGTKCLKYQIRSTAINDALHLASWGNERNITLQPGGKWLISFYVKSDTANISLNLDLLYGTAGYTPVPFLPGTLKYITTGATLNTWNRYSYIADMTSTASTETNFRLVLDVANDRLSTIWIDGIMIEGYIGDGTITTPSPYNEPPNFLTSYLGDLNATRNVFRGTWSISQSYLVGDAVLDAGGIGWTCKTANTGGATPTFVTVDTVYTNQNWSLQTVNGVSYSLLLGSSVLRRSALDVYSPSTISPSIYQTMGTSSPAAYAGVFRIATSPDGVTYTDKYTPSGNETITTYTIPVGTSHVRVRAYLAGGTTTLLDEEIITTVTDGLNGLDGITNYYADLSNDNQTIATASDGTGAVSASTTMTVYAGTVDDSTNWTFSTAVSNVTTSTAAGLQTQTVNGFSVGMDTGYIDMTATRTVQTNLLSGGESFDSTWLAVAAFYSNAASTIVAPNGTLTAKKFTCISVVDSIVVRKDYSFAAQQYSSSIYAYVPSQTTTDGTVVTSAQIIVDYGDQETGTFAINVFNKWVRVELTNTLALSRPRVDFNLNVNGANKLGAVVHLWGGMVNTGAAVGKYAPYFTPMTRRFTLSKSKQGYGGDAVNIIFAHCATQPAATGTTPLAPTLASRSGWSTDVATANASNPSYPLWASIGTKIAGAATYTWDIPLRIDGDKIVELTIYGRATTGLTPTITTNGSYTFGAATPLSTLPTGANTTWGPSVPSGSSPVWTARTVVSAGAANTSAVAISGWSTPVLSIKNGNTYSADITGGVRSINFNALGTTPLPTMSAFTAVLYANGTAVTPTSILWEVGGHLSVGAAATNVATFTPTCATTFNASNNDYIRVTMGYDSQTVTWAVPIAVTKVGAQGQQARVAYITTAVAAPPAIPTAGVGDVVPTSLDGTWSFTPTAVGTSQFMYRSDGLLNSAGTLITWTTPYLSTLKVGKLSALTANVGNLVVESGGNISSGQTAFNTGTGFWIENSGGTPKMSIGNSGGKNINWDGTSLNVNGDLIGTGNINANAISYRYRFTSPDIYYAQYTTNGTVAIPTSVTVIVKVNYARTMDSLTTLSLKTGSTLALAKAATALDTCPDYGAFGNITGNATFVYNWYETTAGINYFIVTTSEANSAVIKVSYLFLEILR